MIIPYAISRTLVVRTSFCLFMMCLAFSILCGCVSTEVKKAESAEQSPLAKVTLENRLTKPDMTNANSCFDAGTERIDAAWIMHSEGNTQQAKVLLKEGIDLLDYSYSHKYQINDKSIFVTWIDSACHDARVICADEPEFCKNLYSKSIRKLNELLLEFTLPPINDSILANIEYSLSRCHFYLGNEDAALQAADMAWKHGQRYWDDDLRECLIDYVENNDITPQYLPLPQQHSTLKSKLLFPLNVVPNMLCEAVYLTYIDIYATIGTLTTDEPGWAIFGLIYLPWMPIGGCCRGIYDAWRGIPFWDAVPFKEEF